MMKHKPTVGQQMFALIINSNARHREQKLRPVRVMSVGRKYFKALPDEYADRPHFAVEYHIEDGFEKTDYTSGWRVYETEKEYEDEKEFNRLHDSLRETFNYGKLGCSLDALRIAYNAIHPNTQQGDV